MWSQLSFWLNTSIWLDSTTDTELLSGSSTPPPPFIVIYSRACSYSFFDYILVLCTRNVFGMNWTLLESLSTSVDSWMVMCREQLSHMLNMEKQKHQQAQLKEQQEHQARLQVGPHTHSPMYVCTHKNILALQSYACTLNLCSVNHVLHS